MGKKKERKEKKKKKEKKDKKEWNENTRKMISKFHDWSGVVEKGFHSSFMLNFDFIHCNKF